MTDNTTNDDPLDPAASDTAESDVSEDQSSDSNPRGSRAADTAADGVKGGANGITGFTNTIAYVFTRIIPRRKGEVFWKKMAAASIHNWYKQSGAEALALNGRPNNHVKIEPVKYLDSATADGKPGWKAKGRDKVWATGADGRDVDYLGGRTPVIWTDDDAHEIGGRFQARVGEAIDLGKHKPLYRDPEFNVQINAGQEMQGGAGQARADGGMQIELDKHGVFDGDSIIDLSSGDAYDGMALSWRKYTETYPETSTTEEMRRQEERGRIAEMDPDGQNDFAKKMLMITGGIILAALFIVFVLPKLLSGSGGGGGGGGGVMPIMLDTMAGGLL